MREYDRNVPFTFDLLLLCLHVYKYLLLCSVHYCLRILGHRAYDSIGWRIQLAVHTCLLCGEEEDTTSFYILLAAKLNVKEVYNCSELIAILTIITCYHGNK